MTTTCLPLLSPQSVLLAAIANPNLTLTTFEEVARKTGVTLFAVVPPHKSPATMDAVMKLSKHFDGRLNTLDTIWLLYRLTINTVGSLYRLMINTIGLLYRLMNNTVGLLYRLTINNDICSREEVCLVPLYAFAGFPLQTTYVAELSSAPASAINQSYTWGYR